MPLQKFSNNAVATLSASINSVATTITVTSGQGALFPALTAGDYFYATIIDSSNNIEIVKITARSTDSLTAVRAQEGTIARSYVGGDKISLRITAAGLANFAGQDKDNTFSGTNIFSGSNSFTGAAVAFTNVPTFASGSLPIANGGTGVSTNSALASLVGNIIFPVGSLYSSTSATNPGTSLGFGTWAQFGAGRMMMGAGGAFGAGTTGGSNDSTLPSHTHTASFAGDALAAHAHNFNEGARVQALGQSGGTVGIVRGTGNTPFGTEVAANSGGTPSGTVTVASAGSSGTNANLPPYIVVYMWQRTA